MLWGILLLCALVLTEGSWQAKQLFHEVYGQKLAAAKTPQAKTALAKELLELARKETDLEAKRIELQTAKRLAIEAEAAALALDVVRAWVEAFPETSLSQAELLERAELLWKEAEAKKGMEKLAWQVDAIELWLQSRASGQLTSVIWANRIATITNPTNIVMHVRDASWTGQIKFSEQLDAIINWVDPQDTIRYTCQLTPGKYVVSVEYAADHLSAYASLFELRFASSERSQPVALRFQLVNTGQWPTYRTIQVGRVQIRTPGTYTVHLVVLAKRPPDPRMGIISLRRIRLDRE